jgi:hypothetical protein
MKRDDDRQTLRLLGKAFKDFEASYVGIETVCRAEV